MEKNIFKLVIAKASNDSFRINVDLKGDSLDLTIFRKLNAWNGQITYQDQTIQNLAREFELSTKEYLNKVMDYFCNTPENVDFTFHKTEFVINCNLENGMKIKYFWCKLKKVDYGDSVESLLEKFYIEKNDFAERVNKLSTEKEESEKYKNDYESKLNQLIERKLTDEQDLYNNFVLVLNEKKKRIQHLNELLEAFRRGRPTINPPVELKRRRQAKTKPEKELKEEVSDSGSENGSVTYDTDEEKEKTAAVLSKDDFDDDTTKNTLFLTPTSKDNYDLFADDSPPRHLLPKRMKTNLPHNISECNKPSTSKQDLLIDNKNLFGTGDNTPDVNFSTQDLLDNL